MGLFALIVGFFIVLGCLLNAETGLYIITIYSFFAYYLSRFLFNDSFPVGVITDILLLVTFFGLFVKPINLKDNFYQFSRTSVIICFLIVVLYHFLELFNPNAHSVAGWFQIFRRLLSAIVILFVSYCVFDNYKKIRRFVILLFALSAFAGLYGCIQQWHGLFDFERYWVDSDETRYALFNIYGVYRKFSTMSDPTAYGIVMAACANFFLILCVGQRKYSNKLLLLTGAIFMILGMSYSGTRTAVAMAIGGLGIYFLLSINKRGAQIFAFLSLMFFLFLLYVPIYNNNTINRFRSSFNGTKDESYNVREMNRKYIQPYIYTHPFGGGLYTVGGAGLKYNPGHYLAGFPPDSGYLRKALEIGWIGLILINILYFVILKYAVTGYFRTKKEGFKTLYAACFSLLFSFYIGEYTQEAIGQLTDMVVYYPVIALILRLKYFDGKNEQVSEVSY
jgi:hypothetical protein